MANTTEDPLCVQTHTTGIVIPGLHLELWEMISHHNRGHSCY